MGKIYIFNLKVRTGAVNSTTLGKCETFCSSEAHGGGESSRGRWQWWWRQRWRQWERRRGCVHEASSHLDELVERGLRV